jgi:micrococcal nuclease
MAFALFLTCRRPDLAESPPAVSCRVARVSDGDSFYCDGGKRVRLIGIDTPERDQGDLGRGSRDGLLELMPIGAEVRLETDVRAADQYQRTLAYAWLDSVMINREMVRRGWAVLYTVPPNVRYEAQLRAAQDSARSERAGHWSTDGFACAPDRHRKKQC